MRVHIQTFLSATSAEWRTQNAALAKSYDAFLEKLRNAGFTVDER